MHNNPQSPRRRSVLLSASRRGSFSALCWLIWTLTVVLTGVWNGWSALIGAAPLDLVRLCVESALVGVVGLLLLTIIDMRLRPWHFLD
jgi:hypothetical protein